MPWCPYPLPPPASATRKRARRVVARAATTTTNALATVFCCILSIGESGYGGVDAFTFAAVAHSAFSPASSLTTSGHSLHVEMGGGRRRPRGTEVMLGIGGAAFPSARREAVCFCVPSIVRACPTEAPRTAGVRTRAYPLAARERWSTAVRSTPGAPDMTQAVDAEFSDAGDGRERRAEEESAANEAEERTRGDRRRRASPDSKARDGGRLPLPFFDVESVGLKGRWEEMGGNFLLRPPNGQAPKALLHFLGGAFVGAAPHLTYNYLLSGLAEMGFLVVATPYPLGFDYLTVCDDILDRFEEAAVPLAAEYGALPVVGIGHSCGALLQLLITCLFPDTPRAANALISFNNKPVTDAVPGFEELILPLVTQVLKEGTGKSTLFSTLEMLRETVDNLVDGAVESRFAPAVLEHEVVPLVRQVLQITDQLPGLFEQIADGTREFTPTPEETRDVVSKMYRARRTIMVRFENDSIDESEAMKDVIQEGKTLLRMKRPLVDMELRYEIIKGSHVTPLTQNVFISTPLDSVDPLLGVRQSMKKEFLKTVNHLGQILVDWLEESAPPVAPPSSSSSSSGATAYPADVALGAGREAGGSSPMPAASR